MTCAKRPRALRIAIRRATTTAASTSMKAITSCQIMRGRCMTGASATTARASATPSTSCSASAVPAIVARRNALPGQPPAPSEHRDARELADAGEQHRVEQEADEERRHDVPVARGALTGERVERRLPDDRLAGDRGQVQQQRDDDPAPDDVRLGERREVDAPREHQRDRRESAGAEDDAEGGRPRDVRDAAAGRERADGYGGHLESESATRPEPRSCGTPVSLGAASRTSRRSPALGSVGCRRGSGGGLSRAIRLGLLRARETEGCETDRGYHCRACAPWSRESTPNQIEAIERITNSEGDDGEPPAVETWPDSRPRAAPATFGGPASRGAASRTQDQPSSRSRGSSSAAASACARACPGETITIRSRTLRSTNSAALRSRASSSPA